MIKTSKANYFSMAHYNTVPDLGEKLFGGMYWVANTVDLFFLLLATKNKAKNAMRSTPATAPPAYKAASILGVAGGGELGL